MLAAPGKRKDHLAPAVQADSPRIRRTLLVLQSIAIVVEVTIRFLNTRVSPSDSTWRPPLAPQTRRHDSTSPILSHHALSHSHQNTPSPSNSIQWPCSQTQCGRPIQYSCVMCLVYMSGGRMTSGALPRVPKVQW